MASSSKVPQVLMLQELADYLRCHPATIHKLLRKGQLPGFKVGSEWRLNAELIDKWRYERERGER
jgi:excisionase family DNA binding protein